MHTNTLFGLALLLGLLLYWGPVLAGPPSASLDWIEVTQAIQDLDNSVPLVAGKKTMIRAYLTLSTGPPLQLHNGGRLVISSSTFLGTEKFRKSSLACPEDQLSLKIQLSKVS